MTVHAPADWYPDPLGRHEVRYWDGSQWTPHVWSRGRQETDPLPSPPAQPASRDVQQQVQVVGVANSAPVGGGPIFTEPILVINQKAKLFEVKAEYAVYDQHGQKIGAVRQVGENFFKKAMSALPDDNRTRRLQIVDKNGGVLMFVTRPAKLVKSTVTVTAADGSLIGQIVQKNLGIVGKIRFQLQSGGRTLGSIRAEDWHAWDFNIEDRKGNEIARITKTWAGFAKEWFTKADNYVLEIHRPLEEPLRALVVAAALTVDTVLRQDSSSSTRRR